MIIVLLVVSIGDILLDFNIVQDFIGDGRVVARCRIIRAQVDELILGLFGNQGINNGHFVLFD